MTSGFGVDPAADGSSGTSSADIRKIFGGLYSPGVISGCQLTTSASAMTYTIAAGVIAIKTANEEIILAPVALTVVATTSAPVSGTRTDIIYAQQRYPSIEGDANIVIGVGAAAPARSVILGRRIVSAGATNTNGTTSTGSLDYSIPYGASLGILHQYRLTNNTTFGDYTVYGQKEIYLPTDRLLKVSVLTSVSAEYASGFSGSNYCEAGYDFNLDGVMQWRFNTPGLHQAWAHYHWSDYVSVSAGYHTVNFARYRVVGPGWPLHHYQPGYMPGTLFTVEDAGPQV